MFSYFYLHFCGFFFSFVVWHKGLLTRLLLSPASLFSFPVQRRLLRGPSPPLPLPPPFPPPALTPLPLNAITYNSTVSPCTLIIYSRFSSYLIFFLFSVYFSSNFLFGRKFPPRNKQNATRAHTKITLLAHTEQPYRSVFGGWQGSRNKQFKKLYVYIFLYERPFGSKSLHVNSRGPYW